MTTITSPSGTVHEVSGRSPRFPGRTQTKCDMNLRGDAVESDELTCRYCLTANLYGDRIREAFRQPDPLRPELEMRNVVDIAEFSGVAVDDVTDAVAAMDGVSWSIGTNRERVGVLDKSRPVSQGI